MRAAVLGAVGDERLQLRDDVTVVGPGPGEVRVRLRAAGVCRTDLHAQHGIVPQSVPAVLGHEGAGEIVEVGDGVTDLAVGDHVIVNWVPACGTCANCVKGEPALCMTYVIQSFVQPRFLVGDTPAYGLVGCGVFAQEAVLPRPGVVRIDEDVPFDIAALIGCGVMTGVGAVVNTAQVRPGQSVLVLGCGGVGLAAVQGARVCGATVIAAVDTVPAKLEAAKRFGATHGATPDGLAALVAEATAGEGFDYALDVVAAPQTIRASWDSVRRGGAVVVVGVGSPQERVEFTPFELAFLGKRVMPSLYGDANPARDYPRMIGLWRAGQLDLAGMITQRITLDDVNDALAALGNADVIRQVILFD